MMSSKRGSQSKNNHTEPTTACRSVDHTMLSETKKPRSILQTNTGKKLTKKSVSWRKENDLVDVAYFKQDETVKKVKSIADRGFKKWIKDLRAKTKVLDKSKF